jgi:hypothetical protein
MRESVQCEYQFLGAIGKPQWPFKNNICNLAHYCMNLF